MYVHDTGTVQYSYRRYHITTREINMIFSYCKVIV